VPIDVTSLGLHDLGPVPPLDEALETATRFGLDISQHRARPLKGERLGETDLVLGFERTHVAAAVVDADAPRERTFTLPELVELLGAVEPPAGEDPHARVRESVRRAAALRAELPPQPVLPEIPDPWGASPEVFEAVGAQVIELSRRLVSLLFDRGRRDRREVDDLRLLPDA
jgi:protein-tyrosine-phosphatase